MANVAIYNMEGKEVGTMELNDAVFGVEDKRASGTSCSSSASLQISAREHRRLRPVLKFPEAEESRGDRKEPVMQDRVRQELRSGPAAELYSLRYREITPVKMNKKEKRAALKSATDKQSTGEQVPGC